MMRFTYAQLKSSKFRAVVTILAIVIAVGMLTVLVGLAQSGEQLMVALLESDPDSLNMFTVFVRTLTIILCGILALATVLIIYNSYLLTLSNRMKQFGLLKSIGATPTQMVESVLYEGLILWALAVPFGLLLGYFMEYFLLKGINSLLYDLSQLNQDLVHFDLIFTYKSMVIPLVITFVATLIAAYFPVRSMVKISVIQAITQTQDKPDNSKSIKQSGIVWRILGFTGAYSTVLLRSNRKKYGGTLGLLVLSILLIVGSAGFTNIIGEAPSSNAQAQEITQDATSTLEAKNASKMDVDQTNRMNINVQRSINGLVYGFTGVVMMVALSSVVKTIFVSLSHRRREFALLYSVGIDKNSIKKTLEMESLLLGFKALAWGLPLGFLVYYILNKIVNVVLIVPLQVPLVSLVVAVIWACVLPMITTYWAIKRNVKTSIVDALKFDF